MDIFPSCLAPTGEQFENDLNKLLPHFPTMQVDIADNILVTGQTLTTFEALQKLASNPHSADHTFDFHLMVRDFMPDLRLIQDADSRLHIRFALLHHAADPAPDLFTKQSHRFGLGLVINPDETVDTIIQRYPINSIPIIQLMTVVPGAQGRAFIPDVLNKIEQLKTHNYRGLIMLDGGINDQSLPIILKQRFRPDAVCPGSYFTGVADVLRNKQRLLDMLESVSRKE